MPKVIKTSPTPNPLARKFHLDCQVVASGSRSFPTPEAAQADPAAKALFAVPSVTSVFYVGDVVTVNQSGAGSWDELVPRIADLLEETLEPTIPPSLESPAWDPFAPGADIELPADFDTLGKDKQLAHINRIFDEMVRPGLAGDGGGLQLLDLVEREVLIHYEGACGSCPSATQGTMDYIERILREKADPSLVVVSM